MAGTGTRTMKAFHWYKPRQQRNNHNNNMNGSPTQQEYSNHCLACWTLCFFGQSGMLFLDLFVLPSCDATKTTRNVNWYPKTAGKWKRWSKAKRFPLQCTTNRTTVHYHHPGNPARFPCYNTSSTDTRGKQFWHTLDNLNCNIQAWFIHSIE